MVVASVVSEAVNGHHVVYCVMVSSIVVYEVVKTYVETTSVVLSAVLRV